MKILLKNKIQIPHKLKDFYKVFEKNNFKAYLVGGAVRDIFLKKRASDWDIATNATPQDVIKMFKFVVPTGFEHGTVTVHFQNEEIEVTTFRTESGYSDGRHPDKINYAATIEEDLSRRDLTINAIAINLSNGKIVDPFNGRKDIKRKLIKTVGNPHERFMEDGLRPIRALRFSAQLNFKIDKNTYSAIFDKNIQHKISSISIERFRDEFMKMMSSPLPSIGLKKMEETGIFKIFLPEILECRNCIQKDDRKFHIFDVMDHCIYACDGAPKDKPLIRLAAFLHDCGKPKAKTNKIINGMTIFNFYKHEEYSTVIAKNIMTKLKFSNDEIKYVCHLIENHMFHYTPECSDAAIRRFIVKVGPEYIQDLFDLRLADMYGKNNLPVRKHDSKSCDLLIEFAERIKKIQNEQNAFSIKDLKINGNDLINNGIPSGKKIGIILNQLFETVLEDPNMNTKEKLMELAVKFNKEITIQN